jgi:hypothetical protein
MLIQVAIVAENIHEVIFRAFADVVGFKVSVTETKGFSVSLHVSTLSTKPRLGLKLELHHN